MKDTDAAWLAGYIDGDGCITLTSSVKNSQPMLHIDSCDEELLQRAVALCGGHIVKKTRYADRHRQAFTWRVKGTKRVAEILAMVRPYMCCAFKVARADIVLNEWGLNTVANGLYPETTAVARAAMIKRFMDIGSGRGKRLHF